MKLMIPPIAAVDAFYRSAVTIPDAEGVRLTTHCLQFPCEDGMLFYHTMTGALLLSEDGETVEDCRSEFLRRRFLVNESFDENKLSRKIQWMLALTQAQDRCLTTYTIFTTTECNARCYYCYELGIRRFTMSDQTAAAVADFIVRSCGRKKVTLQWFGGEPLLNRRAISLICGRLRDEGIPYSSTIITNGYLFDPGCIKEAYQLWRLTAAHITLDGTKEVYLKTKAYVNGDPQAFKRVTENIRALLKQKIAVTVRLNINRKNYEDILCLCDDLGERFGGIEGFSVSPVLLTQYVADVHPFATEEIAAERYRFVQEKLKKLGLLRTPTLPRKIRCTACMADNDACIVVYPDGTLGKCEHYDEKGVIGSVFDDRRDDGLIQAWKQRKQDEPICADCPLYPVCIRLEKCPQETGGCTPFVRELRIMNMKERVLKSYRDMKKKG